MTSISNSGWGSQIQALLQQQVNQGTIPSTDQSALSSAITGITSSATSASSGTTSPASMSSLIDNQVSSGNLSSTQANELKGLFQKAHGHMHVHAASSSSSTDSSDPTDPLDPASSTSSSSDPLTSIAQGASSAIDSLSSFVSGLRSAVKGAGLYGAGGATAGSLGSMLFNAVA